MDRHLATLSMLLPAAPPEATVPEWVQLVPAGEFSGRDGRGPWRMAAPEAVLQASRAELPLPIDETHSIDLGAATGQPSPARGWVRELELRAGSLWGRVEWTATGTALLAERAYRGISPAFVHDKSGRVLAVLRASLTNIPNLRQLATLHSQDPGHMDLLEQLRQLHGLPADAATDAVLNACRTAHGAAATASGALAGIAAAAGLAAGTDATAIVTALNSQRQLAGESGRLAQELTALQGQLTALSNERARERATQVVDGAIRDGRAIPKALREHYIARHCQDPAAVELELAAMPSLHSGGVTAPADAPADRDPRSLALLAQELQDREATAGRSISFADAVARVAATPRAA